MAVRDIPTLRMGQASGCRWKCKLCQESVVSFLAASYPMSFLANARTFLPFTIP